MKFPRRFLRRGWREPSRTSRPRRMLHPTLHTPLAQALEERGYDQMTPVQSAVIAEEAHGRDLIVSASTGSGKTVAFGLAMAGQLIEADKVPWSREPLAL